MRSLKLCALLSFISFGSFASEVITEQDQFIDTKTGKYVHVCEQVNGELIVKESCGKFWDKFPRKREELLKAVKSYKEIDASEMVMLPVKDKDGNTKIILGRVLSIYENGNIDVMEYYSKRFGINPGTITWKTKYEQVIKLKKNHPLLKHNELCAKEDLEINYSYDGKGSFSLKKGDTVSLKGILENDMAIISLNSLTDNFFGYGLNNQLPLALSKLEVCANDNEEISINNSTRSTNPKLELPLDSHNDNASSQSLSK